MTADAGLQEWLPALAVGRIVAGAVAEQHLRGAGVAAVGGVVEVGGAQLAPVVGVGAVVLERPVQELRVVGAWGRHEVSHHACPAPRR